VQAIILERRHRPIFLIDIANPRDIDPGCNEVDNVYLYNIDDLQSVVSANLKERQREAERAEVIIEREVEVFQAWLRGLDVVPTIVSLRDRVEEIDGGAPRPCAHGRSTPEQRETIASDHGHDQQDPAPADERARRRAVHQTLAFRGAGRLFGLKSGAQS
jgi:glutamyl-tRNA reductase